MRGKTLCIILAAGMLVTGAAAAQPRPQATPAPAESTPEAEENQAPVLTQLAVFQGPSIQDAIDEMIELGLVTEDGELLETNEMMSTSITGDFNLPDDSMNTYPNVAGGALVSFRPAEGSFACGFAIRFEAQGPTIQRVLFAGITPDNQVIVLDDVGGPEEYFFDLPRDIDFYNPHFISYVFRDGLLTVWVDGEPVVTNLELAPPAVNEDGEAPESQTGTILQNSCVMTSHWVYAFGEEPK
jgi:hypothetical protein